MSAIPPDLSLRDIGGPDWDADWDALAGSRAEAGFMQASYWARFKRAEGYEARRYGLFRGDALIGGGSVLYYPTPDQQPSFLVCPEGPVLPWEDTETARAGLRLLESAARRDFPAAIGLRVEPHLPPPRPSLIRNWQRAPLDLTPVHTLMLDLTQSDEELRAAMKPKGRYNLGLSHRHGVTVRLSTDLRDLAAFYPLFAETSRRQEFFGEPYGFFLNLAAALFPAGHAALFLAEYQGELLAATLTLFYGRRATYLYGGSSMAHRNVMPCYALHWAALQEARRRGCVEYDFYGIDPFGQPGHLYAGFSTFKRQFGGMVYSYLGAHELLFYDRLAGHIVDRLKTAAPEGDRQFA